MASLKDRIPEKKKVDELKKILADKFHAGGFFSKPGPVAPAAVEMSEEKKVEALKNLIQQKTLEAQQGQAEEQKPFQQQGLFGFLRKKNLQTPQTPGGQKQPAPALQTQPAPITSKPPSPPRSEGEGFSIQGFLKPLEDMWYDFLDKLDEHVPVYNVVDRIDDVVPSFYVFLGLILLLLLLLLFFVAGPVVGSFLTPQYSFLVADESGNPVGGASVSIVSAGQSFDAVSDANGAFSLKLPDSFVQITASKEGFETYSSDLALISGEPNRIILKQKLLSFIRKNVEVYLEGNLFDGSVRLTFYCSNAGASAPARLTINDGVARDISFPENCGSMSVTIEAQGFETQTLSFGSESTLVVYLQSSDSLAGSVKVTLVDEDSGDAVVGASVALYDNTGIAKDSKLSSASGIALFEDVAPGNYYVQVSQARGYGEKTSSVFSVQPREQFSFTLELKPIAENEIKKIFLRFVDSKTSRPIEGVQTWLVVNNNVLPPAYASDGNGYAAIRNLSGSAKYGFIANHSGYVLFVEGKPKLVEDASTEFTTVRLTPSDASNSMNAVVEVFDGQQRVQNAYVALYNKDYNFSIAWANTNAEGKIRFEGLPPGTYHAFAQVEGQKEGSSQTKTGKAGETITLRVQLSNLSGGIRVVVVNDNTGQPIVDANVSLYAHPEGYLLDENKTNSSGSTRDFNYTVDLAVYAVVSKPGFISAQSEPKQVLQDIVQTIPVRLVPDSGFDKTSPKIEFVQVENFNGPVTGYLLDNAEYYLKFRMFVPQNTRDGNSVIFLESQFLRFRLTEMGGDDFSLSYFDCEDKQNPYNPPACAAKNPPDDSIKQLRIGFGAVPSQFYTFRIKANIPDIGNTIEHASAFFGEKIFNTSGEPKTDPSSGLGENVFTINEPIPCNGPPEDCPVFAWSVDVARHSDGSMVSFDRLNQKFELELNQAYDMNVKLANITDVNDFHNLTFKISDPSNSQSLGVGTLDSDPFVYTSSPFNLPPRAEYKVDNLALDPKKANSLVERFEVQGISGAQVVPFEPLFDILEPNTLVVSADPDTVEENTTPTVVVTVTDSRNNSIGGAQVVMVPTEPGDGEPASTQFTCDNENDKMCENDDDGDGDLSFTLPVMDRDSSYWFVARKTQAGFPDSEPPFQVIVLNGSADFGPGGVDCVEVTPTELTFSTNDNRGYFTVSAATCEENILVTMTKVVQSSLADYVKVRKGGQNGDPIGADEEIQISAGEQQRFYVDIRGAECPDSAVPDSLCPGEYRVVVAAKTSSQENPSKVGTVRVFKMPESDAGHCFELCKGDICSDYANGAALFDVKTTGGGDGTDEFNVKNNCLPTPLKKSLAYMKTQLSTCSEGGYGACTSWEEASTFAKIEFNYTLKAIVGGVETSGTQQLVSVYLFSTEPQDIGVLSHADAAADAYLNALEEENPVLKIQVSDVSVTGPGAEQFESMVSIEDIENSFVSPSLREEGQLLQVQLKNIGDDTSTDNAGSVFNYNILSDTGALFKVSDHVPLASAGSGDYLPVTFTVKLEAIGDGQPSCSTGDLVRTVLANNVPQKVLNKAGMELVSCINGGTYTSYTASIVGDPSCPPSYTEACPQVKIRFGSGNYGMTATTSDPAEELFALVVGGDQPTTYNGLNYQLIFLADTSGSLNNEWTKLCELTDQNNGTLKQKLEGANPGHPRVVVSTHTFAMGRRAYSERPECKDRVTYVPWVNGLAGEGYSKVGETHLVKPPHYGVSCTKGTSCDFFDWLWGKCSNIGICTKGDVEQESWVPILQTLIKIFNGEITQEQCEGAIGSENGGVEICSEILKSEYRFAGSLGSGVENDVTKIFVVLDDSDPTGMLGSDDSHTRQADWRTEDGSEKQVVDALVGKITGLDEAQTGKLRFYFINGSLEAPGLKTKWPEGDSEKSDVLEAMEFFVQSACSEAENEKCGLVESIDLDDDDITVDELASSINEFIEEIDNTVVREERFHVILDVGDASACFGPNGRTGVSGENSVGSLKRKFDWTWDAGFSQGFAPVEARSFCNPELSDNGGPNPDYVFCDAAQFTNMALNRVLVLATGDKEFSDWRASDTHFTSTLIKDGFGQSFLEDFKDWAKSHSGALGRKIPTDLFGSYFDLEKYVEAGNRLVFEVKDEDGSVIDEKILPASGFYKVDIGIAFDRGYSDFMGNDNPTATITISLQLINPLPPGDNLLYFLPFDGEIGLGSDRDDYGVGFALADGEEDKVVLFKNNDGVTIETLPTTGGVDGLSISVNKLTGEEAFENLNKPLDSDTRGIALKLAQSGAGSNDYTLEFTPSYASPVLVRVDKPADSLDAEAVFYVVDPSGADIQTGWPFSNWVGVASNVDFCNDFTHALIPRGIPTVYGSALSCGGGEDSHGFDFTAAGDLLAPEKANVFGSVIYTLDKSYSLSGDPECGSGGGQSLAGSGNQGGGWASEADLTGIPDAEELSVGLVLEHVEASSFQSPGQGDYCLYNGETGGQKSIEVWFNESDILRKYWAESRDGLSTGFALNDCSG